MLTNIHLTKTGKAKVFKFADRVISDDFSYGFEYLDLITDCEQDLNDMEFSDEKIHWEVPSFATVSGRIEKIYLETSDFTYEIKKASA